ncbi:MAG: SMP-30/gluconolactonase/LRE family protein [Steroidobacteraceae bacterium]
MPHDTLIGRRTALARLAATGLAAALPAACAGTRPASTLRPVPLSAMQRTAHGVRHGETVVATREGRLYVSNADSACAVIEPDGATRHMGRAPAPNGIAMDARGRIVIANFGLGRQIAGPLQRLDPATGAVETLAEAVNGRPLVACNFPVVARDGSIYCTHTSWGPGMDDCIDPQNESGFIFRVGPDGTVSVARDRIPTPNGCCFDADERWLYVAQIGRGNIVRLRRRADGSLGEPEPWGPKLGETPAHASARTIIESPIATRTALGHPDGIGFDVEGNLWVTLVLANRIVAITPSERIVPVIEDPQGEQIALPTGLTWGGPRLEDLYIACAARDYVVRAPSPVPGLPLVHQRG